MHYYWSSLAHNFPRRLTSSSPPLFPDLFFQATLPTPCPRRLEETDAAAEAETAAPQNPNGEKTTAMMATKSKVNPLNNMHTAGIFSDMTIDGPVVGTLVLIVDRAKNLPNRKTIGKQDPYCAARLGKEAKKTTTDIRGGQTPKW